MINWEAVVFHYLYVAQDMLGKLHVCMSTGLCSPAIN